jgi:hypothetical protein
MGLHLLAFGKNVTLSSTAQDLPAIADGWASADTAGKAILPIAMKMKALYASGVGMDKPQIVAPSLKRVTFPRVAHWDLAAIAPANPNFERYFDYPVPIGAVESFNVRTDNTNAGNQDHFALAFLQDMEVPTPPGPSWTLFGTGAVVAANRTWASGVISFEDAYPSDLFAVIGMRVVGTNVVAARLIPNSSGPRPGCIGQTLETTVDRSLTWDGAFGVLTTFRPPVFPFLEVLGNGATTTQRVYLQVVKIG